jgi:hypothetical protein
MLARGRGRRPGMLLRVGILARASIIQKKFVAFGRNHKGYPYLLAVEDHTVQCLSGLEGGGVHVASYMLVLHRSGQGVLYVPSPPPLLTGMVRFLS